MAPHLGHPSSAITRFVLSKNCISYSKELFRQLVRDAFQQTKSSQLPYPVSTSRSKAHLELAISNVWGFMLALLMTSANLHGSISQSTNLKFFLSFRNSSALLSACLIGRLWPCKQTWGMSIVL
jgi:hypothetical protein